MVAAETSARIKSEATRPRSQLVDTLRVRLSASRSCGSASPGLRNVASAPKPPAKRRSCTRETKDRPLPEPLRPNPRHHSRRSSEPVVDFGPLFPIPRGPVPGAVHFDAPDAQCPRLSPAHPV